MSGHKEFINEYIATSDPAVQTTCSEKLINLIQANQLSLLSFIQALQIYITSTNDDIRVLTFKLLSDLLAKISPAKLFPKDIEVLMAFLFSKFSDKPVIRYVMTSLHSLVCMKYYNFEKTDDIFKSLLENYNPKENAQAIRLTTLNIFNHLISVTPQESYSDKIAIECFLHISQNEKDPNNLLLVFEILNTISKKFDITEKVQELFDTMFRYYPISFKSSTEAQESQVSLLKDSLNSCLASNDLYAAELFPNLIEKYNAATASQVKLDILSTISSVSQAYSSEIIAESFLLLWNTLKYTILNQELAQLVSISAVLSYYEESSNDSDKIFHSALFAIQALSTRIGNDEKMLIFDDLSSNLLLTERNRRFLQSFLTLAIIFLPIQGANAAEEKEDADLVLNKTLSALFSEEQPQDDIRNKRLMLIALSYFTDSSYFLGHLVSLRDNILLLLQTSLASSEMETTLRTLAIQLTINLILSPNIVDPHTGIEFGLLDEEKPILISKLGELLVTNAVKDIVDQNPIIEKELLGALSKSARVSKCENDVIDVVNTLLMGLSNESLSLAQKCKILDYVIKLAQTQSLVQTFAIRLSNLLPSNPYNIPEGQLPVVLILQGLAALFLSLPIAYNTETMTKKFMPNLLSFVLKQGGKVDDVQLTLVSQILRRLTVGLKNDSSLQLLVEIFNMFSSLLQLSSISANPGEFDQLLLNVRDYPVNLAHLPLFFAVLQGIDLGVDVKAHMDMCEVVNSIAYNVNDDLASLSSITKLNIFVGCSVTFNKYLNWGDFLKIFGEQTRLDELTIWCLYGLILKNDSMATEKFVSLIDQLDFSNASKAINIIFSPIAEKSDSADAHSLQAEKDGKPNQEIGLDLENALIVCYKKERTGGTMVRQAKKFAASNLYLRNMWKQRILEIILKKRSDFTGRLDYTLPLILTFLPEDLYNSHLRDILPGLINTIESCGSNKIAISILTIICNVITTPTSKSMVKPYIDTIIPLCLKFIDPSLNKESKFVVSKELMKQSLKCLAEMTLFDLSSVVPFKHDVIKSSQKVLENKNRLVRMHAVSVRQAWEDLGVDLSM